MQTGSECRSVAAVAAYFGDKSIEAKHGAWRELSCSCRARHRARLWMSPSSFLLSCCHSRCSCFLHALQRRDAKQMRHLESYDANGGPCARSLQKHSLTALLVFRAGPGLSSSSSQPLISRIMRSSAIASLALLQTVAGYPLLETRQFTAPNIPAPVLAPGQDANSSEFLLYDADQA